MEFKNKLQKIIAVETLKTDKKQMLSDKAMKTFNKLLYSNNTALNGIRVKEAIKQYADAIASNTKLKSFTIKTIDDKRKQNAKDYKTQTLKEESDFLQTMSTVEPIEEKHYKVIDAQPFKIPYKLQKDLIKSLEWSKVKVVKYTETTKERLNTFKITITLRVVVKKKLLNAVMVHNTVNINVHQAMNIRTNEDIQKLDKHFIQQSIRVFEEKALESSGWSFDALLYTTLTIYETQPLRASSYIPTPAKISCPKCGLVNIRNSDNKCFEWCIKYHQTKKAKHDDRISVLKKVVDKYTYENVNYPASIEDVRIFEAQNENTAINIFEYNEAKNNVELISRSNTKGTDIINLLVISDEDNEHYVYIKKIASLYKASTHHEHILCETCFRPFTEKQYSKHKCDISEGSEFKPEINYRDKTEKMKVNMSILKKMIPPDFYITADFEATNQKTNDQSKIAKHVANSYGIKVICTFDPSLSQDVYIYRGEKSAHNFIGKLIEIKDNLNKIVNDLRKTHKYPILTKEEATQHKLSTTCHICELEIEGEKVRDHCHLTGKYRGSACKSCNVGYHNMQKTFTGAFKNQDIPVIFHNLRGYDGHFIIQEASKFTKQPISVISQSFEKYMSISFEGLKFIDSMLFMNSSLETLATNLIDETNEDKFINFKHMKEHFKENTELLCKKGTYPYEWVDNIIRFNEKELPKQECFYSKLSDKNLSIEEYAHAQNVYKTMKCKDFGDYHDIYLKTDVLLLTDIIEAFRKSSIEKYRLDPLNYVSSPSLSWDAMLLQTRQELGLIYDEESRQFFNIAKRGGIVNVGSQRYTTANNKYMKKFNPHRKSSFISYLDMNNQYGAAMCDYLPYELVGFVDVSLEDILKHKREDEYGYFVQCNISYPHHLHDKFKDYPPCPITTTIATSLLSPYQKEILEKNNNKHANKSAKLVLNLFDKVDYVCHYRYLQKCHELGCVISNVSKVMKFKQSQWLKPYIDKNTDYRKNAKNEFEKDLYKLLNNSIFGKTCQDVMKYTNFEIITNEKTAVKRFTNEAFKSAILLNEMYFIESSPKKVNYDKPCYIGCAILDIAKLYMLDFHYDYIKPKYGDNAKLIYTDTDSFVYSIETDDLYQDQYNDRHLFDLSNVQIPKFYNKSNSKVVGKMKDETGMIPITEFIALGAKCYSFKTDYDTKEEEIDKINKEAMKTHESNVKTSKTKKAKGVVKTALKKITHDDYMETLMSSLQLETEQICIRSFKHQNGLLRQIKTSLSCFEDKMYRIDFNTGHPYGYINVNEITIINEKI